MMEGNRKLMEENRQSLEGRLDGLGQNHQQVSTIAWERKLPTVTRASFTDEEERRALGGSIRGHLMEPYGPISRLFPHESVVNGFR
ncbi:hypothetical protein LINGRAHAP2_LOCUS36367 [Linum grandiflorum]